ncbi:hypothetical protein RI367_007340 [Sorochytrium milnesiophthora]
MPRQETDPLLPSLDSPILPPPRHLRQLSTAAPTFVSSVWTTLRLSPLNLLLLCIPLGIAAGSLEWNSVAVFWINFFAIVPLAKLLGFATEELALRTNQTIGGLLNATFGNAVELIVSIIALRSGLIRVVQASLLGSILSNLLLVTGFSFLFGGIRYSEQTFNATAANTSTSLLALSVMSLLLPAAFAASMPQGKSTEGILDLSRGTAVILLVIYLCYLAFQLKTHSHLYEGQSETLDGESDEPMLTTAFAVLLLIMTTVFVSINSDYLVGSIEGLSQRWHLSQTFVGLILLPIVGNAAEHVTAVTVAMKNKMDLCIGVAIGSSTQIALLVIPLLVILGWVIGQPMTLHFETFETAVMFISVLIVNYLISDGRTNWLEGAMLLGSYATISIAFYVYPSNS